MTTEDDFQTALSADLTDWQSRLVFADWLEERNDPRAEGYRALGVLRKRPGVSSDGKEWFYGGWGASSHFGPPPKDPKYHYAQMPDDWWQLTEGGRAWNQGIPSWRHYRARQEAEDAVALAFSKLPPARRAELLAGNDPSQDLEPPVEPKKPSKRKKN